MLLQNAWVSDRTLCFLASGKPAVVQYTGPSRVLPDAAGLFRFRDIDEAARALDTVAADYDHVVRCFSYPVSTRFVDVIVSDMSMGGTSEAQFMESCRERKQVVRQRFTGMTRLAGVWQVNLYDIPRNTTRHWLDRVGLLGHWRAMKRS